MKNISFDVKIGKTFVKYVDIYKYLGKVIDSKINWPEHVDAIKTKLLKTIGVVYKTGYFVNEKSLYLI